MKDEGKTKEQLIEELSELRQRIADLEASETERKRAEEVLRESEQKYRNLVERANDGITIIQDGIVKYVNPRLAEMWGGTVEGFIGTLFTDYVHPDELPKVVDRYKRRMAGEEVIPIYETVLKRRDGSRVYVELNAGIITYYGKLADLVIIRDLMERRRAEEALRESKERYHRITEAITDYIYTVLVQDGRPHETIHGPACVAVTGYAAEEFKGDPYLWINMVHEEDRKALEEQVAGILSGVKVGPLEHRIIRKDGVLRWVRNTPVPHYDSQGRLLSYDGLIQDITERKEQEAREEELKQQLGQAERLASIGTLAGGIAHHFNNLLTGMMGHTELLLMDTDRSAPRYASLQWIMDAGRRAADLVKKLLTFSRQEKYLPTAMNLNTAVDDAIALLRRTLPEHIAFEVKSSPDLRRVLADPVQMEQILMNLCVNARDAMPEGGTLTVETANVMLSEEDCQPYPGREPGAYVRLSVADTGVGMDQEIQQRIFDPFFTTKGVGEGTGLGLSTVYGIVQDHKGIIDLQSRAGVGTVFRVYLPAMEEEAEETGPQEEIAVPGGSETILLVEDEETVLNVGREALEHFGYRVYTARDGEEGLSVYRAHRDEIALVISDAVMPKMGARELLSRLRELDPKVKMLVMSGYRRDTEMEGIVGFIRKPYHLSELLNQVREVLDRRET